MAACTRARTSARTDCLLLITRETVPSDTAALRATSRMVVKRKGAEAPVVLACTLIAYDEALALQRELVEERKADRIPDVLLLLQHPPVITLGVKGDGGRSNVVAPEEQLSEIGVQIHETGRGGDVTYHGPGQVVGYPIIDLKPDRCDVHKYVRDIEEVMIRVCAEYGVTAGRICGLTGTWVGNDKIGAIGIRISKWVTSHGFAFNVSTNLDHFRMIVPCGITDHEIGRAHV